MSQNQDATNRAPVLETAWRRYAELDYNAEQAQKKHRSLRIAVIILSVAATLLAILNELLIGTVFPADQLASQILRISLISVPIAGSIVLAFANRFQQGERWLALRAGTEEIKKEIYLYRTVHQHEADRNHWLDEQVGSIQQAVFETVENDLILKPYVGNIPPYYDTQNNKGDEGFGDLGPDGYLKYRLEDQLDWHQNAVFGFEKRRTQLQVLIFVVGGTGTLLAAIGLNVWVALTASLAAALTAYLELYQYDWVIKNYNRVIVGLKRIQDHWQSLKPEERCEAEFFKLVKTTEEVLWSQHEQFISTMRETLAALQAQDGDRQSEPSAQTETATESETAAVTKDGAAPADTSSATTEEAAGDTPTDTEQTPGQVLSELPKGAPHAFVVMPFGKKSGRDGQIIDFNCIYQDLIKPALITAGFEPFRADEESVSGDILTDMFQELLLADLVVADLSIDNANAFYELGVRHALRKRGVVHIQSGRAYMPFDVFNVRTIPYHTAEDGKPDREYLEKDIELIAKVARDTWASDQERVHSPIFNLLDGLPEPDRKALQTPLTSSYWQKYHEWQQRVRIARRQKHIGDVLLLIEEVPNSLLQEEAIAEAGRALKNMGNYALALPQYQRGLEINPKNVEFRREEAFNLGRLKRGDEAIIKLERLLQENPNDSESMAYLGRLYKDMWQDEWTGIEDDGDRLTAACEADYLLKRAIDAYLKGYGLDQNHFYSGINALTLSKVMDYLMAQNETGRGRDPEQEAIAQQLPSLTGAAQFSLEQAVKKDPADFWAFASLGDFAVCTAQNSADVTRAYKKALALSGKSKFSLQSTLAQLKILESLAFRPEHVRAGIDVLQYEIDKSEPQQENGRDEFDQDPVQVFLFGGHMIDRQGRPEERFPPAMEEEALQRIEATLNELKANDNDLAITPGAACGGDILFIEGCLACQMKVEVYLPFHAAQFIEESVSFPKVKDNAWTERFWRIHRHPNVTFHFQPDRLGPPPGGDRPFRRNNRWTLYSALGYGIDRIRFIVLWNGTGGDGPGGTDHMVQEVRRLGGVVRHLDTTKFDYWKHKIAMPDTQGEGNS